MNYTYITDCSQIDLDRHAFIEASAGTGKTYTIETLVVRLLLEKKELELENILLVTFTEKATSELKQRIQEKLAAQLPVLKNDPLSLQKIRATLDAFDKASIFTIHSFCQSVLSEFAFENGSLFTHDLIDDGPLLDALLKEQMRKTWPAIYGAHLADLLTFCNFARQKASFGALVTQLAKRFRPEFGDEILPRFTAGSVKEIFLGIGTTLQRLKSLITSAFWDNFAQLNLKKRPKALLHGFMEELSRAGSTLTHLAPLLAEMDLFQDIAPGDLWLKNKQNPEICPQLQQLLEAVCLLIESCRVLPHILTVESIERLRKEAFLLKQQNGWISYDDMIGQVAGALLSDTAGPLLQRLRGKYKVAFVDEFQDTDTAQWRIFSKIFLPPISSAVENRLYLIGDPKQAIYSFRGADVFVYLSAKKEMLGRTQSGQAAFYSLATNWRSQPELISAFNRLFSRNEWFGAQHQVASLAIDYHEVGSAEAHLRSQALSQDHSGRSALTIVDISQDTQAKRVKTQLAEFITAEILHLMRNGDLQIKKTAGETRPLNYGDICILVRGKNDLTSLEPLLLENNIPYTYYKKPGLFLSEEALHLSLVWHALLNPESRSDVRKALLTPFFAFPADALLAYDLQPVTHPVKRLLLQWQELASTRQWSRLFQSLMEDSGLIFRQATLPDWDRRQTNYSQMFEHLQFIAYRRNLDFRALAALLDSYRKELTDVEEEADIHQIDTEEKKIQVMTMHVSKGLQFPVVFVAGGLTQSNRSNYFTFHRDGDADTGQGLIKVFDLAKSAEAKQLHDREAQDENKRLFYVALTRAQFKLYVPYYAPAKSHRLNGPVTTLLTPALAGAFPRERTERGVLWLTADTRPVVQRDTEIERCEPAMEQEVKPAGLALLLPADYRSRRYRVESFSSLHIRAPAVQSIYPEETGFQAIDSKEREDDERLAVKATPPAPAPRPKELPGGTQTGSMLHDIFEVIDFAMVAAYSERLLELPETRAIIETTMALYGLDPSFMQEVCAIVAATLTTPVSWVAETFSLGDLKQSQRLHETEFYFPMPMASEARWVIPELELKGGQKGYIRGFIDLIFQVNGKFYIADWKSNRLEDGYGPAALEKSMAEAGYPLQYKIYTVATLRWLAKLLGNRFDPFTHFGGIFYFYVRGMGGGNGHGIYHVSPQAIGPLDRLEQEIIQAAGG